MNPNATSEETWELERYELNEGPAYSFEVGRRSFLSITRAGLLIATSDGCSPSRSAAQGGPSGTVAARLRIGKDGAITVFTSKVEVGQGSRTQITQAAAEELKVSVDRIRLVMADSSVVPDDGGTAGSRTTPRTIPSVRKDAAAARAILLKLAAAKWGGDPETLEVRDGAVADPSAGRAITYAELAQSADLTQAFGQPTAADVKLTSVKQWSVLGSSVGKRNSREIVTGSHRFPSDITRPNMLYGKVLRPASFGATLASIDLAVAQRMEGLTVVRDGNFVGCTASTSRLAQQAVEALATTAKWNSPPHPSSKELFAYLKEHAVTEGEGRRRPRRRTKGSVESAMADAKRRLSASYEVAYVQHAPMEPRAAVAEWDNGRLTVWTGTQQPCSRPRTASRSLSGPSREGTPDRSRHRRRIRRQAHRRSCRRSSPSRQGRQAPSILAMDAARGTDLGLLPPGGVDRSGSGARQEKLDHGLELHELQFRCIGDRVTLRHPEHPNAVFPLRLPAARRVVPRSCFDGELLRAGVVHG